MYPDSHVSTNCTVQFADSYKNFTCPKQNDTSGEKMCSVPTDGKWNPHLFTGNNNTVFSCDADVVNSKSTMSVVNCDS